jgi:hypothetical protein
VEPTTPRERETPRWMMATREKLNAALVVWMTKFLYLHAFDQSSVERDPFVLRLQTLAVSTGNVKVQDAFRLFLEKVRTAPERRDQMDDWISFQCSWW